MESILTSVKESLGIVKEYEHFDTVLIMHINTVFTILTQLGVGPAEGFSIRSGSDTWDEFLPETPKLEAVKSYMYLKVKKVFDPPSGAAMEALNSMVNELEWRLNVAVD